MNARGDDPTTIDESEPKYFGTATPKRRPMDETKLLAVIREFEAESYGFASGQLASERSYAIERYLALPYGDEVDGRSQVVDTGLRDTVEWLLPQILRVFLSGQRVVEYTPASPEDEQQAEQETDYVNHIILEKNDSFNVFSTWFRDALISKVGYVKAYWKTRQDVLQETYKGLTDDMLMVLQADPQVEVVSGQSYPDPMYAQPPMAAAPAVQQGQTPQTPPQVPMLHDCTVRRVHNQGWVAVDNVPPEEIYVHRSLRTIAMEDCEFVQHRARRTLSQLRQDGYEIPDDVSTTGDDAGQVNDQITISRDRFDDDEDLREDLKSVDPANRRVWFRESYLRVDFDGDGVAELRKVCHIGNAVVANDECDLVPFAAVTPIVFPHRHIGMGYDDLCDQPSRVATAIQRGFLDNLYLQNNGRYGINVDNVNVDDMLVSRPGGLVRVSGSPSENIFPFTHPAAGDAALQGLEWAKTWREMSTGVSADQSNMSADVLKGSTATGIAQGVSAGQTRVEAVTRSFATGVKELFGIVHALTLKNATSDEKLKLNNNWVTVDPREWVKRTGMAITVGLGGGTKEMRIQQYMMLGQMQAQGLQIGICTPENLYNTGVRIAEEMGHKNVDEFFTDPAKQSQRPPQPPPEVQVEQIRAQGKQAELQQNAQIKMQELQMEAQVKQQQLAGDQAVQTSNDQRDAAKMQMEMQMKDAQGAREMQQRDIEHIREQQTQLQIANVKASSAVEVARIAAAADKGDEVLNQELVAAGQEPIAHPMKILADSINQLVPHLAAQNGPKRVVRDASGRVAGIEPVTGPH